MLQVNLLDLAAIAVVAGFALRGLMRGLVQEVAGLVGVVLAFTLASQLQGKVQPTAAKFLGNSEWTGVIAYAFIFVAVLMGVSLFATALRKFMSVTFTSWLDRVLGGVVGVAKGLLLATVVFYLMLRFMPDAPVVKDAYSTPFFKSMGDYLRNVLPTTGGMHF